MSHNKVKNSPFTDKRIRRGIKLDRVNPSDLLNFNMIYCCEQCSYFNPEDKDCLLGYPTSNHTRDNQLKTFSTNAHMAFCRFLEID